MAKPYPVGPYGSPGGVDFDDAEVFGKAQTPIKKVIVTSSNVIHSIKTVFADGTESPKHGGGGGNESVFELAENEFINSLTINWGRLVKYLRFTTNLGKKFEAGGPSGEYPITVGFYDGNGLKYFVGGSGLRLDRLGAVFGLP